MEVTQYIHGYSPKGEAIVSYKITNKKTRPLFLITAKKDGAIRSVKK